MAPVNTTHVHVPVAGQVSTHPEGRAVVFHGAAETGHKTAGKTRDKRITVGTGLDCGDVPGVGRIIHDPDHRAGFAYAQAVNIRDLNRVVGFLPVMVTGHGDYRTVKDAATGVRVTEVEAALHLALGVIAVTVNLEAVAQVDAHITEELVVILELRRAPDHHGRVKHVVVAGVFNMRVAGVHQGLGVRALKCPAGGVGFLVFHAEVEKAAAAHGQTDVAGEVETIAVAFIVLAPARFERAAFGVVLQFKVDHPGDGVGTVLGGGAVTQHFHPLQRNRGDDGHVRALRTVRHAVAQEGDDRGPVAALAVHQHQGGIRRQAAQGGRAHQGGGIVDGLLVDLVGRDQVGQRRVHIGRTHVGQVLTVEHVHRHQ